MASVLGQRCIVGAGSVVRNSYLFDGAVVGPNCVVEHSIIGSGVQIKERTRVERGCLIADGVVVGPQATLKPFSRLSKRRQDSDDEDEEFEDAEEQCEEDDDDDEGEGEDADDEDEVDSELEDVEASGYSRRLLETLLIVFPQTKILKLLQNLGLTPMR